VKNDFSFSSQVNGGQGACDIVLNEAISFNTIKQGNLIKVYENNDDNTNYHIYT
jgi:hypothetical protein